MGKKALIDHYGRRDWPYHVVETGQTLKLGKKTVSFLETRMLHWPDSMMSYIPEDRLLLSSDGFGQHWATSQRFDDEVDALGTLQSRRQVLRQYPAALFPRGPKTDRKDR